MQAYGTQGYHFKLDSFIKRCFATSLDKPDLEVLVKLAIYVDENGKILHQKQYYWWQTMKKFDQMSLKEEWQKKRNMNKLWSHNWHYCGRCTCIEVCSSRFIHSINKTFFIRLKQDGNEKITKIWWKI